MTECLFCKIAGGKVPAKLVYEDDTIVVFRDIHPQAPTHVLLIPRKHIPSLSHLSGEDDEIIGYLVRKAGQIARAEGIAESGYRLIGNSGPNAGQSVGHVHFHLLGGRALAWPPG